MTATSNTSANGAAALRARMMEFAELSLGWDGDQGLTFDRNFVDEAWRKVLQADSVCHRLPFVAPVSDGSLLLDWDFAPKSSVEVYLKPDGGVDWLTFVNRDGVQEIPVGSWSEVLRFLDHMSMR